jgi:hypothetical protein
MRGTLMTEGRQMRWFGHPAIVGGLLVLLVVDFLSIRSDNANRSMAQRALLGNLRPSTMHGRPLSGVLCRSDGGLEWIWHWDERLNEIMLDYVEGYEQLDATVFFDLVRHEGIYHLTQRTERLTIWCGNLTPDEWAQVPVVVAGAIAASDDTARMFQRQRDLLAPPATTRGVDRETRVRRTPLQAGRLRNVAATGVLALALPALVFGRTWLWPPFQWRRRSRAQRGLCAACGYDLAGIADAAAPCPECGVRQRA